jgi:predicted nucleic acid-binding Zn ribbon protein
MARGAVHIQHILKEVIKDIGGKKRLKQQGALDRLWIDVVGDELACHTYVAGIKQKIIQVKVDSAPLLNELANFRKQEILNKIQAKLPISESGKYVDIKFMA